MTRYREITSFIQDISKTMIVFCLAVIIFIIMCWFLDAECQADLMTVSEKPIPYAEEVYQQVREITGCQGDVLLRVYPADELQALWELNGGKGKAPEAFTFGTVVFSRKVSRSILAHEFTHAMCPKLPEPIDEIIPRWVSVQIWRR
jgi:hypothetical protein